MANFNDTEFIVGNSIDYCSDGAGVRLFETPSAAQTQISVNGAAESQLSGLSLQPAATFISVNIFKGD